MIAKVETHGGKGFTSFSVLDSYIERFEAVARVRHSPALDPNKSIPAQMDMLASQGTGRVKNPAYHFVLSWNRDGVPEKKLWDAVDKALEALGCDEHQWIAAQHIDTTHDHVHVLVNRIHPETLRAWSPEFDYYKLQAVCRELEPVERRDDFISSKASDYEVWTGQQSMQSWTRERILPEIKELLESPQPSWRQMHALFGKHGLSYEVSDDIGKVIDTSSKPPRVLAATAINAIAALPNLEKTLGQYTPRPFFVSVSKENGYGALVQRFALPSERMQEPAVRPLYDRFIRDRLLWMTRGRYERAQEREDIKAAQKTALEEHREDVQEARAKLEHLPKQERDVGRAIVDALGKEREEEIRLSFQALRKSIILEKPAALFRKWLKEKANDGDPSAGVALGELRKLRSNTDTHAIPQSDSLPRSSGAPAVDTLNIGEDPIVQTRLAEALRRDVPPREFDDELLAIANEAHETVKQTPEYVALVSHVNEMVGLETTVDREIMQHAMIAVAGVRHLSESDIRLLYAPLEEIAPYAEYGPIFAAKVDEAQFVQVENIVNSDDVQLRDADLENSDSLESESLDSRLDSGSITGGDVSHSETDDLIRNAGFTEAQTQEAQKYRAQYEEYVKTVGLGLFKEQRQVYIERRRAIDQEYSLRKAAASELDKAEAVREKSKAMGWKLRTEARLVRSYRIEEAILEDCSGEEPPKSFRTFLLEIGTPEATELANFVADRPADMATREKAKFLPMADVASHLTWADLEGGKVQYHVNGRAAFVDTGRSVEVRSSRDKESAAAALMMAKMKFNGVINLDGSDTYKRLMLRQAIEMGIEVTNPELQDLRAAYTAEYQEKIARGTGEQKTNEKIDSKIATDTRKRVEQIYRDPNLTQPERREKVDEIIIERTVAHVEDAAQSKVAVATNGLTIDGTLEDVLVFNRRAYAVVRTSERGSKTPTLLAPITKEAAKQIAFSIGNDVRAEHIGVGNMYEVDTDHVRQTTRSR